MLEKKKKGGKWDRLWDYSKVNLLFLMNSQEVSCRNLDHITYEMIPRGSLQGPQRQA